MVIFTRKPAAGRNFGDMTGICWVIPDRVPRNSRILGFREPAFYPDYALVPVIPDGVSDEKRFKYRGDDVVVSRAAAAPLHSALIFHDSFMSYMKPFISRHFQRTYFIQVVKFYPEIVGRVRPSVVIEEMVERGL